MNLVHSMRNWYFGVILLYLMSSGGKCDIHINERNTRMKVPLNLSVGKVSNELVTASSLLSRHQHYCSQLQHAVGSARKELEKSEADFQKSTTYNQSLTYENLCVVGQVSDSPTAACVLTCPLLTTLTDNQSYENRLLVATGMIVNNDQQQQKRTEVLETSDFILLLRFISAVQHDKTVTGEIWCWVDFLSCVDCVCMTQFCSGFLSRLLQRCGRKLVSDENCMNDDELTIMNTIGRYLNKCPVERFLLFWEMNGKNPIINGSSIKRWGELSAITVSSSSTCGY